MVRYLCFIFLGYLCTIIQSCSPNDAIEDSNVIDVPDYFADYLILKEKTIRELVNASNDCSSFIFFTDTHWGDNQKQSPFIINHIIHNTSINDVVFGGDVITQRFENKDDAIALGESFRIAFDTLDCNMYYIYGNHDNNSDGQPNKPERHLSDEKVYEYLQKGMSDCKYGNYFNFYFDRQESKTRFVCLDTGRYYYAQFRNKVNETANYLIKILNETPNDWNVVILSHIWYELKTGANGFKELYLPDYSKLLINVLDDYNLNKRGQFSYASKSIPYNFENRTSKVVCCIGGHCHLDAVSRSDSGIPIIVTTTDSKQVINNDKAIEGTITEQSISVFILDYSHRIIKMIRIGRGEDANIPMAEIY